MHDAKANNFDADDNDEDAISIVVVLCAKKFNVSQGQMCFSFYHEKICHQRRHHSHDDHHIIQQQQHSKVKDKRKELIAENSSSSFLDNETAADNLDRNVYVTQKGSEPTQHSFLCYRTTYTSSNFLVRGVI